MAKKIEVTREMIEPYRAMGFSDEKIGKVWGISETTVLKARRNLGIPATPRRRIDRDAIRRYYLAGKSRREIADLLGLSTSSIHQHCNEMKLGLRADLPPNYKEEIAKLVGGSLTDAAIASIVGVTRRVVAYHRYALGVPACRPRRPRKPIDVERLRRLIEVDGLLQREAAKIFNIQQPTVSQICIEHGIRASNGRGRRRLKSSQAHC